MKPALTLTLTPVMLQAPSGSGKSLLIVKYASYHLLNGPSGTTILLLVPTQALVDMFVGLLQTELGSSVATALLAEGYAEVKAVDTSVSVHICTVDSFLVAQLLQVRVSSTSRVGRATHYNLAVSVPGAVLISCPMASAPVHAFDSMRVLHGMLSCNHLS